VLSVHAVAKFIGDRKLFADVSFSTLPGERIGLIGLNGTGKSTLFRILLGEMPPDSGSVVRSRGLTIGHLPQQVVPTKDKTVLEYAMDVHEQLHDLESEINAIGRMMDLETDPERSRELALRHAHINEQLERLGGYDLEARAAKILAGLGFRDFRFGTAVSTLSGGWIMRLEIARLLLSGPELLLLDEPTNHLDLMSLLWLEDYLLSTSSAMLIVSHDRSFLNRLVTRVLELEQGRLHEYAGNYDAYLEEKARRREVQLASYQNQQDRIRQAERFIERNRYRKSTASRAQSRLKVLEKMERIEAPVSRAAEIHFTFPAPVRSGKRVLELHQARKAYGEHLVYSDLELVLEKGDRIAFIGENGAGKSTLLKMLAGVEPLSGGERIVGHNTLIGYYAQHQWEQLRPECTVLEEAASISGDIPASQLRGLLGAFLFHGEDVHKRVSILSGGEKARLILCRLLLQRPNVLLMDEPTNHLDIPAREVLEGALREYQGTICFISHDRRFINNIANRILVVERGRTHIFPGNYDDYRDIWSKRLEDDRLREDAAATAGEGENRRQSGSARKEQDRRRLEARWRNELYQAKRPLQERLERVESELQQAHRDLDAYNQLLAAPDTYHDGARVQDLRKDYKSCQARIAELTQVWEENALMLEEIEENFWKARAHNGPG